MPRFFSRIVRNPLATAGWALFIAVVINFASGCGTKWTFGHRYGMPRSLVAADGKHYGNGDRIDPLTRVCIANDNEEEVFGTLLLIFLGHGGLIALDAAIFLRAHHRRQRRHASFMLAHTRLPSSPPRPERRRLHK